MPDDPDDFSERQEKWLDEMDDTKLGKMLKEKMELNIHKHLREYVLSVTVEQFKDDCDVSKQLNNS